MLLTSAATYGIKEKENASERFETINFIDCNNVDANDFAIAEKISITGKNKKIHDIVLYVNGFALGIIELKYSTINVAVNV